MDTALFQKLMQRVRSGDEEAATELVRRFEPQIRREVRVRLSDPSLRRVIDSMDITQSVLGNFFTRAALGQFDLNDPRQLLQLLVTMAQNRLKDWARYEHRERRDRRRAQKPVGNASGEFDPVSRDPSPSQAAAGAELIQSVRARLNDTERAIAERRAAGLAWEEIALEFQATPEALRKRLARGLDRVSRELGLEL